MNDVGQDFFGVRVQIVGAVIQRSGDGDRRGSFIGENFNPEHGIDQCITRLVANDLQTRLADGRSCKRRLQIRPPWAWASGLSGRWRHHNRTYSPRPSARSTPSRLSDTLPVETVTSSIPAPEPVVERELEHRLREDHQDLFGIVVEVARSRHLPAWSTGTVGGGKVESKTVAERFRLVPGQVGRTRPARRSLAHLQTCHQRYIESCRRRPVSHRSPTPGAAPGPLRLKSLAPKVSSPIGSLKSRSIKPGATFSRVSEAMLCPVTSGTTVSIVTVRDAD